MKSNYLTLMLIFGLIITSYAQDFIIAGQTIGTNVHHTDYEPDYTATYPGVNEFLLDVNNDGEFDLLFSVYYHNNCDEYITWWTSVETLTKNIKIISLGDPESGYVRQLSEGDTISIVQSWNSDSITNLIFQYFLKVNSTGQQIHHGEFSDGYLGYKMISGNEKSYGWINIHCTYETIISKENSILNKAYGIDDYYKSDNLIHLFPNPCFDQLTLSTNSNGNINRRYEVTNIYGRKVRFGQILNKKEVIDTKELEPGYYIIEVKENERTLGRRKFINKDK